MKQEEGPATPPRGPGSQHIYSHKYERKERFGKKEKDRKNFG